MDTVVLALRVVVSLAVVLGLLWVLQRRFTRGSRASTGAHALTVVSRQRIGAKASVVVVDNDGRRFLLGVTEQSVTVLHSAEQPQPADGMIFAQALDEAHRREGRSAHALESPAQPLQPVVRLRPRGSHRSPATGTLGGSILSPATWKQTAAALRQGR